jgi:LAGLIDADG endonuclease
LLNPWFIKGFADAEVCFNVSIFPDNIAKLKWAVKLKFLIRLHVKYIAILKFI